MKDDKILTIEADRKYTFTEFMKYLINNNDFIPGFVPKIEMIQDETIDLDEIISSLRFSDVESKQDNIFYSLEYIAGICKRAEKSAKKLNKIMMDYVKFVRYYGTDNISVTLVQMKNAILRDALMDFGNVFYNLRSACENSPYNNFFKEYLELIGKI
ncbi:hypothetical protein [uncultured Brachyspira sp.]|uniref:hypothetical protein n=1 Tax=uncultured Brachyspira sp. TaxID=221953 RepID=UPI00262FC0D6|nr:hypothetical protein [uncultured Brachyspira sp.]